MAKKSMVEREKKRLKLIVKYREKRLALKKIIKKADSYEEVMKAYEELTALPVNSSAVRYQTRCTQCGRPHAVYQKFELCRLCVRLYLMSGDITGGRKSSW